MINSIKTELKIWLYSGRIFVFFACAVFVFVCFSFISISEMQTCFAGFEFSQKVISDEEEMWQKLNETHISEDENVNTLLRMKMQIEGILNSLNPQNAFEFCEEVGIYIFPLLMTIIGAVTICNDYDSNILRLRVARVGRWKYFFAKQVTMIAVSLGVTFLSMALYRIISGFIYKKATGLVTSKYIGVSSERLATASNGAMGILFFLLCVIIFLEFGFCVGYIFRLPVIPIVIVGYLWYIGIMPTYYEPRNAIYNLATKIYSYSGVVPNAIVAEIPLFYAILITTLMLVLPMLTFILVWKKRSVFKNMK